MTHPRQGPIDRPILFSAEMIRALLAGRKTQTRRRSADWLRVKAGSRLWVREAWRTETSAHDHLAPSALSDAETILYEADADWSANRTVGRLRRAMYMPRWASRCTLVATADARVERLENISDDDALAEGVREPSLGDTVWFGICGMARETAPPRTAFAALWNDVHGDGAYHSDFAMDVIVLRFSVISTNIDSLARAA